MIRGWVIIGQGEGVCTWHSNDYGRGVLDRDFSLTIGARLAPTLASQQREARAKLSELVLEPEGLPSSF